MKCDYPMAKSLEVIPRNVAVMYLVSTIKIGDQGRVLNYVEIIKP